MHVYGATDMLDLPAISYLSSSLWIYAQKYVDLFVMGIFLISYANR